MDALIGDGLGGFSHEPTTNRAKLHPQPINNKPGDALRLTLLRRDMQRALCIALSGRDAWKLKIRKIKEPSDLKRAVYESWLGREWGE